MRGSRLLIWTWGVLLALASACGDDGGAPASMLGTAGTGVQVTACGAQFCQAGQVCINDLCVQGCTLDAECGTGKCCNQQCVDVTTSRDHCGACGTACSATQQCTAAVCTGLTCQLPGSGTTEDAGSDDAGAPVLGSDGCPENELCTAGGGGIATCMCGVLPSCPSGEACSASGTCACGSSGISCSSLESCCGNGCANLLTDPSNCGACGNVCPGETACLGGSCGCSVSGETACGGDCSNLNTDAAHCGACDSACPPTATCNAGECVCPAGQIPCGGACVDASDDAHCGACNVQCEGEASCGERTADSGQFECLCPNFFDIPCDGVCVDPTDEANCGSCGNSCGAATTCQESVESGERDCLCPDQSDAVCDGQCVDLQTDEDDCGACGIECLAGESCDDGECSCPDAQQKFCDEDTNGQTDGQYACIDATTRKNCGGCGVECLGMSVCDAEAMECVCTLGNMSPDPNKGYCEGGCKDIKTDEQHCGGCGIVCPAGSTCTDGECSCPSATQRFCSTDLGYACIDVVSDDENCGACGNVCSGGSECCNSACVDPDTYSTVSNCGACGTVCMDYNNLVFPFFHSAACEGDVGNYSCAK